MRKIVSVLSLLAMVSFVSAHADQAQSLYVIKSVNIDAPADKTWAKIANFGDLGAWHPAVAKTEIVTGANNHKGAKRVLTLQDGGKVNETLTAYSANHKSMTYIITGGVLPVTAYQSSLHVYPNGVNKSVVVWESSFLAKVPNDEKTASDTINAVYDTGLGNLKKITE